MTSIAQAAIDYAAKQIANLDCDRGTAKCRLSRAKGALQLAQQLEPSERLTNAIKRIDDKWPSGSDSGGGFYGYPDKGEMDYDDDF